MDLSADSLDMADMMMEIEEEFDVTLPENVDDLKTVGEVVVYLESHGAK